ncbi:MAG: sodium:proton antiporter [Verrucomicrobia bacterium]|nr:sodium:proton antiporter [Verrucomicrobiota bacterium]
MVLALMDMGAPPPLWLLAPFALLILGIAVGPLLVTRIWHRYYPLISLTLALVVVAYYLLIVQNHFPLLASLEEYISFLSLIGSLFVVSGGIRIGVAGEATPFRNVIFLMTGGILANILGTTGAAMLLIRPWIRMNRYRITGYHIVFFIFVVANVGGCLTPIGDPPLFLGYLRGVPFFWTLQHLWLEWLFVVSLILAVFYFFDRRNFARASRNIQEKEAGHESFQIEGRKNGLFLGIILFAVLIRGWGTPWFLSDGIMVISALVSYRLTSPSIRQKNGFSFEPLQEVAWLFFGIFATLIPVIHLLTASAHDLGHPSNLQYYWMTGTLSAFLDNAPTYLTFLTLALNLHEPVLHLFDQTEVARFALQDPATLAAISLGAVFFGAATYIGNGPNLLVKSIADSSKIHMPSFFGYILRFVLPILLPILALTGWIFLRG